MKFRVLALALFALACTSRDLDILETAQTPFPPAPLDMAFTTNILTPSLFKGIQESNTNIFEALDGTRIGTAQAPVTDVVPGAATEIVPERPIATNWCQGYALATNEERAAERKDRDAGLRAGMQASGYVINEYTEQCWSTFEESHATAAADYCSTYPGDHEAYATEVDAAGKIAEACYVTRLAYSLRPWYRIDLTVHDFLKSLLGY